MASATIATFDAILKEFYIGPINDQLNNEIMVLQMFEKATVDWNGKIAVLPIHLARNTGVDWAAEDGSLPTAGHQTFEDLRVLAKYIYGRFTVTGPAIAAAGKGGANSFVGYVDAEMTRLVDDVRNAADLGSVSGGLVKGFVPDFFDATTVGAGPAVVTKAGIFYNGDFTCFDNTDGTPAKAIRIKLLRGDTLEEVALLGAPQYYVIGANSSAGTIDVFVTTAGAQVVAVDAIIPAATGDTNFPLVLMLEDFSTNVAGAGTDVISQAVYTSATQQCEGIFGNIANPTHFSVSRSGAASAAKALRAKMGRSNPAQVKAVALVPVALTLPMIQGAMDAVVLDSGTSIDRIIMSPLQRQMYTLLLQGTASATNLYVETTKATTGDGGFLGLSYGGVPIQTSRHVSNGMLIMLHTKSWKITSLQDGDFADLDGAVLSRVQGKDSWEGFYRWYWNIVCTNPNRNTVLTGLKLTP
tara:strand:+ start:821 stop:2227 length:1407 start_codon:yes stop_codon:yes gene_type:complete